MIISRRDLGIEATCLMAIAAGISLFFVAQKNNYQWQFSIESNTSSIPIKTEVISPKITVSSQISPDGTKKVIMKVMGNSDSKVYDFSTADEDGTSEQFIFTKTLNLSDTMEIPFNTWSPDNKYFFIQENLRGSKNILVFQATGESFAQGENFLDVADLFSQKSTANNLNQATGWASETLIILNTTKPDGTKGFSYWLEVPSSAIIQLSAEF